MLLSDVGSETGGALLLEGIVEGLLLIDGGGHTRFINTFRAGRITWCIMIINKYNLNFVNDFRKINFFCGK